MPTLTLPQLHPGQQRVVDGARRFVVLACGRKFGKTTLGMDRVIYPALEGRPTAWFAPSYRILGDVYRELQRRLHPVIRDASASEKRIELRSGGVLECWSLDNPDAGRGRGYSMIVIDECALVPNLEQAWQEGIRPMLSEYRGSGWFLSTPRGTANYFYRLFQKGQDSQQSEWISWQMPTASNPYIAPEEIEAMRQDLTDVAFAQEVRAQFVSWEGAVFRRIQDAVQTSMPENVPACSIGVDWAGSGRGGDYTCFIAVSFAGQVVAMDRFRGLEYELQRDRLRAFWERLGRQLWIFAEINNMGSVLLEQLQKEGLPISGFLTTGPSKSDIVMRLALAFERGMIRIPDDPVLIGELQAFEATALPGGGVRYAAPGGSHDDTVMALAIAWQGFGLWQQQRAQRAQYVEIPRYEISPI